MVPWMWELGFQPYLHYTPYNRSSLDASADMVVDPQNLEGINLIRQRAQQLVRSQHLIRHRVDLLHATAAILRANRSSTFYTSPASHNAVELLDCLSMTPYKKFKDCGPLRERYPVLW